MRKTNTTTTGTSGNSGSRSARPQSSAITVGGQSFPLYPIAPRLSSAIPSSRSKKYAAEAGPSMSSSGSGFAKPPLRSGRSGAFMGTGGTVGSTDGGEDTISWVPEEVKFQQVTTPRTHHPERLASAGGRKPLLLMDMENFMQKELALLSVSDAEYQGQRLNVCRQVLAMFASHFTSYSSILSAVLSEYDNSSLAFGDVVQENKKLNTSMQRQKSAYEEKIQQLNDKIKDLEASYKKASVEQQELFSESEEKMRSAKDVAGDLYEELQGFQLRHEGDTDRLLTVIHTVRESERRNKVLSDKILRLELVAAKLVGTQEALADRETAMMDLKNAYKDTVPKKVYDALAEDHKLNVGRSAFVERKLYRVLAARNGKIDTLNKLVAQLREERDRLKGRHQRSLTPRPDWEHIRSLLKDPSILDAAIEPDVAIPSDSDEKETREEIDGAADEKRKPTTVPLSTADRVEALVEALATTTVVTEEEMKVVPVVKSPLLDQSRYSTRRISLSASATSVSPADFGASPTAAADWLVQSQQFQVHLTIDVSETGDFTTPSMTDKYWVGLGTNGIVPVYLRYSGLVKAKLLTVTEIVTLVTEYFHFASGCFDHQDGASIYDVQKWFREFLISKFGPGEAIRVGYAIRVFGFGVHRQSRVVRLLADILDGTIPFRVANDAVAVVTAVKNEADGLAHTIQKRRVRKRDFMEVLSELLQYKSVKSLEELRSALGHESTLNVDDLDNSHPFIARLFEQCCAEGVELYSLLIRRLLMKANSSMEVTSAAAKVVLKGIEPSTVASVVLKFCSPDGTESEIGGEDDSEKLIPLTTLMSRLAVLPIVMKHRPPSSSGR